MATQQLATTTAGEIVAMSLNDKARELATRAKYMISNGRKMADEEVWALSQYCAATDLNPFIGEAYYLPGTGPCPGILGWRKKAQEQLNWEAEKQNEPGAHFWGEAREATAQEVGIKLEPGDIAIHYTLHDWLSNKRWRHAYFETMRQLKEVGYSMDEAKAEAREMTGPEPTWTAIGIVFAKENFGGDKMPRAERAEKRAEKAAIKKRFPRINLPEPTGVEVDYVDSTFTDPAPVKRQAPEIMAELGYDVAPAPAPAPVNGYGKPTEADTIYKADASTPKITVLLDQEPPEEPPDEDMPQPGGVVMVDPSVTILPQYEGKRSPIGKSMYPAAWAPAVAPLCKKYAGVNMFEIEGIIKKSEISYFASAAEVVKIVEAHLAAKAA